jgi:hypothetical protein
MATKTGKAQVKLSDRAMLVGLTVRRWHPHATDKKVSDEVATAHNSDASMGKYRKRLLPKEALFSLATVVNELRNTHYFLTLPWSDDGRRVLNGVGYFDYNKKMMALKAKYLAEYAKFKPLYPGYVEAAKQRLNGLFNPDEYPAVDELDSKFGVDINIWPMPSGVDFRVDLGTAETARIRKEIEANTKDTIEAAMKHVWGRLREVVQHASSRLKEYNVTAEGKTEHSFRDSLVTNIQELLDVIPSLNVTDNAELSAFAAQVKKEIASIAPDTLRSDAKVRGTVVSKADEILKKMEAYL